MPDYFSLKNNPMNTVGRKFSTWEVIIIDITDVAKDDIEKSDE